MGGGGGGHVGLSAAFAPPPGMPDFLEKLHTAALKAKKLEVEVRDYMAAKPPPENSDGKGAAVPPQHQGEGGRSPAQLDYA